MPTLGSVLEDEPQENAPDSGGAVTLGSVLAGEPPAADTTREDRIAEFERRTGQNYQTATAALQAGQAPPWTPGSPVTDPTATERLAGLGLTSTMAALPTAGAVAGSSGGAAAGTAIGGALGLLGGPAAPGTVPALATAGGFVGGLVGGLGGGYLAGRGQEAVLDQAGMSGDVGTALAETRQEHPWLAPAAELAPQVATAVPSATLNLGRRAVGAAIAGGVDLAAQSAGSEPFSLQRLFLQMGAGGALDKPTWLGTKLGMAHSEAPVRPKVKAGVKEKFVTGSEGAIKASDVKAERQDVRNRERIGRNGEPPAPVEAPATAVPEGPFNVTGDVEAAFHETEQAVRVARGDLKGTAVAHDPAASLREYLDSDAAVSDWITEQTDWKRTHETDPWKDGFEQPNKAEIAEGRKALQAQINKVGEGARPLQVYHGTGIDAGEGHFDAKSVRPGLYNDAGESAFYFAEDPAVASRYADQSAPQPPKLGVGTIGRLDAVKLDGFKRELAVTFGDEVRRSKLLAAIEEIESAYRQTGAQQVRPVYLNIKNPFPADSGVSDAGMSKLRGELKGQVKDGMNAGLRVADVFNQTLDGSVNGKDVYSALMDATGSKKATNAALRKAGYDGIRHEGQQDGKVWIAFDKDQIVHLPEHAAAHGTAPPVPRASEIGLPPGRSGAQPPKPPPPPAPPLALPPSGGTGDFDADLASLIKQGSVVQKKTAKLYRAERSARFAQSEQAMAAQGGEAGLQGVRGPLKGPLPKEAFEPVRAAFSQEQIDGAYNKINGFQAMSVAERIKTGFALDKILDPDVRVAPQKDELRLLSRVFPQAMAEQLGSRGWKEKLGDMGLRLASVPREIVTSFDMSNPLRQGLFLTVGHPRESIPAFVEMHKAFFSEKALRSLEANIDARPNRGLYEEMGLYISPNMDERGKLRDIFRTTVNPKKEEPFISGLGEMIPGLGKVVRASNRAYNAYANKLRADVADTVIAEYMKPTKANPEGITFDDNPDLYRGLGKYLNMASGRGDYGTGSVGQALERASPLLNATLFSPRFNKARFDMLANLITFNTYAKLPAPVRRMMLKDTLSVVGAGMAAITTAKWLGGKDVSVGWDPRKSDFGKIRYRDTYSDVWGGFSQWIRFAAQMGVRGGLMRASDLIQGIPASGDSIGQIVDSDGNVRNLNRNPKDPMSKTYLDVAGRFGRSKLAPLPASIIDLMVGSDYNGDPLDKTYIAHRVAPMFFADMYEAIKDGGFLSPQAGMAAPGFYGTSVGTYHRPLAEVEGQLRTAMLETGIGLHDDPKRIWMTPHGQPIAERIRKDMENGSYTEKQVEKMVSRARTDELMARFRSLPLEDLLSTLKESSTEIQNRFKPLVEIKQLRRNEGAYESRLASGREMRGDREALGKLRAKIRMLTQQLIESGSDPTPEEP